MSHRLPEVLALCDRMTILRDGRVVETIEREDADEATLVRLMLGRELLEADAELACPSRKLQTGVRAAGIRPRC